MTIDDVYTITGRGTAVSGKITRGTIKLNDKIQLTGPNNEKIDTTVIDIIIFNKQFDYAMAGDSVSLVLKDVDRSSIRRGWIITEPID